MPEISNYKEKSIFSEALNLVDNLIVDIVEFTSIKKIHILRNYKLKKQNLKKVTYHLTGPNKNIFSILKSFPKNLPVILVAPESKGIGYKIFEEINKDFFLLHSNGEMVKLFSSKRQTFKLLKKKKIPCVPEKQPNQIKKNFIIIKPEYGAGSEKLYYCRNSTATIPPEMMCQEYFSGKKASFSMICIKGQFLVLGCNLHIIKKKKRRITQIGSLIGGAEKYRSDFELLATEISQKFLGLFGFIGIDVVMIKGRWHVMEINCRFTSTYIGLKKVYGKEIIKSIFDLYFNNILNCSKLIVRGKKKIIF